MWWIFTIIVLSFTFIDLSEASHGKKLPSAIVVGTVYCDTCFQQDFFKASHFISGASVAVECEKTSSKPSFRQEVKTDEHGEFKVHLPFSVTKHIKNIKGCSVKLISSSEPYCDVASTATSSLIHLKSRKEGTHIFSAGFFTFKPLKQPDLCYQKPTLQNSKKSLITNPDYPIQPDHFPMLPQLPTLTPLPQLPKLTPLPQLPPLPPLPGVPFFPPLTKTTKLDDQKVVQQQFFSPLPPLPFIPSPQVGGIPLPPNPFQLPPNPFMPPVLPPNPFQPPSLIPPNPFQPPPSIIPPLVPSPPPSIFPPLVPSPPPSIFPPIIPLPSVPPFFKLPPIPGFTPPPPPPPSPTLPIPLPPFPFQPTPGFPGIPPASSSSTTKKTSP